MIKDRLRLCNYDLEWFADEVFNRNAANSPYIKIGPPCMDPIKIIYPSIDQNYATCNLGNGLVIECNDLALIPCHRLAYPFYHGAKFEIENNEIKTTKQLAEIIDSSIPGFAKKNGHPAKRTFQAIRIEVNDEIKPLYNTVKNCIEVLKPGGRLCIITFHSLEDKICKNIF